MFVAVVDDAKIELPCSSFWLTMIQILRQLLLLLLELEELEAEELIIPRDINDDVKLIAPLLLERPVVVAVAVVVDFSDGGMFKLVVEKAVILLLLAVVAVQDEKGRRNNIVEDVAINLRKEVQLLLIIAVVVEEDFEDTIADVVDRRFFAILFVGFILIANY